MVSERTRELLGLPTPVFLYHIDQISAMIMISEREMLTSRLLYLEGREVGKQRKDQIRAINVARLDASAQWRVEEAEFVRWARHKGFRSFQREFPKH